MRVHLSLLVIASLLLGAAFVNAQPEKGKAPAKVTSRTILAHLETPLKEAGPFTEMLKVSELLNLVHDVMKGMNAPVTVIVDDEAYREMAPDFDIFATELRLKQLPANPTMMHILRQAVKALPVKSALVIRAGKVEIVPVERTAKEYLLNQTFHAEFTERRLDQALEELSDLTGVSIVLDPRAKQKIQTPVSARFHDDVALQDAVRLLTDMAELKVVYLVTGLYITTPEHAKVLQKELKEIYERPIMPIPADGLVVPMLGTPPEPASPLAPPLPPAKRRFEPAA
jgi:hypothetical protein